MLVASTLWKSRDSFGSEARGTHGICLQQYRPHIALQINLLTFYIAHVFTHKLQAKRTCLLQGDERDV